VTDSRRNKLILLALFALFFIPVLVAYLMNAGVIHYRATPSKNHGDLVTPPVEMRRYTRHAALAQADDRWKLVYVTAKQDCDEDCQKMLDAIYRIYLASGRHQPKVQPVVVGLSGAVELTAQLAPVFQSVSLQGEPSARELFFKLSQQSMGGKAGTGEGFYIIAPEGFLMMSYPQGFNPSGTIKDMNILLRRKDG